MKKKALTAILFAVLLITMLTPVTAVPVFPSFNTASSRCFDVLNKVYENARLKKDVAESMITWISDLSAQLKIAQTSDTSQKSPGDEITMLEATDETVKQYTAKANELIESILNSQSNIPENGTIYYVSENGDDSNDGLSPESPWKTLDKVNAYVKSGTVLFERGSVFRGQLYLTNSVTYSAYGNGDKPEIRASVNASNPDKWIATDIPNIYKCTLSFGESVGNIVFDNGDAWGILKQPGYKNAGIDGIVSNGREKYPSIGNVTSYKDLRNDLEFFYDAYLQVLYLYSKEGNPGDAFESIEVCIKQCGAIPNRTNGGITQNVVIDNIHFSNAGVHGISMHGCKDVTVQYCQFSFIGGCVQKGTLRYGNAVENFGKCESFTIHHCYTYQAYDCAYTSQWQGTGDAIEGDGLLMKNINVYSCVSDMANNCLEFWIKENNGVSGKRFAFENCNVWNNYSLNNGYGFGQQRDLPSSSMFYGNLCGETTEFTDFNVFDNVMINSSTYALFVYKLGADGFRMINNVYIHEYGKAFANVYYKLYPYNTETLEMMASHNMESGGTYYYTVPENTSKAEIDKKGHALTLTALDFGKGSDDRQFCEYTEFNGVTCAKLTPNYSSANASNEAYKIHFSVNQAIKLEDISQNKYKYADVKYYYHVPNNSVQSSRKMILRPFGKDSSWLGYIDSENITANKWSTVTIDISKGALTDSDMQWAQFQLQVFGGLNAEKIPNGEAFYIAEMTFYN